MLNSAVNIKQINFNNNSTKIISSELFSNFEDILYNYYKNKHIVIITDSRVAKIYLEKYTALFHTKKINSIIIDAGESVKHWQTVDSIINKLIDYKANRNTILFALGGGVVSDITGFVASIYMRGIKWNAIPTTLLAQVDAAIGGKTGINFNDNKNLIGSFCHPDTIFSSIDVLQTLDQRDFIAGLGEVLKYAIGFDANFFEYLKCNSSNILERKSDTLHYVVQKCISFKSDIVKEDEKEQGLNCGRVLLNLGHTFGHAIEAITNFRQYLHGEAVGLGLLVAAQLSCVEKLIGQDIVDEIRDILRIFCLPTKPNKFTFSDLISIIKRDKKLLSSNLRLVLIKRIGVAVVYEKLSLKQLEEFMYGYEY